jgi:hypothetical protein
MGFGTQSQRSAFGIRPPQKQLSFRTALAVRNLLIGCDKKAVSSNLKVVGMTVVLLSDDLSVLAGALPGNEFSDG